MARSSHRVSNPRRGLRLPAAAQYIGVGETKFLEWVSEGVMPKPIRRDGVVLWDIRALDVAFDRLAPDPEEEEDTWADVV